MSCGGCLIWKEWDFQQQKANPSHLVNAGLSSMLTASQHAVQI